MKYRMLAVVTCAVGISAVVADDLPHYKPGLWEITMTIASKPADEKLCLDKSVEKAMYQLGVNLNRKLCSKTEMHSSGSQYTVDTTCKDQTAHTVLTFSGDSAYHTDITSHSTAGDRPDRKMSMDGKWLGSCPADMKPGDAAISVPGLAAPMRMNIKAMLDN